MAGLAGLGLAAGVGGGQTRLPAHGYTSVPLAAVQVTVRTQARTIGLRAVRWAAAERQYEEQLARQRKALAHAGVLTPRPGSAWAEAGREIAAALRAPEVRGGCEGGHGLLLLPCRQGN